MTRKWTRAAQIALERPAEPLLASCQTHGWQRTVILLRSRVRWCLACHGCPRCGARQVYSVVDDSDLAASPIRLVLRVGRRVLAAWQIRGDWTCLACGELLVDWSGWRRAMLRWRLGVRALREGYRRPEERE